MAIALVANVKYSAGGSAGGTTGSVNTTGANLIVGIIGFENASGQQTLPLAFSDNKSNVYLLGAQSAISSTDGVALYYCVSPTVGSGHTFSTTQNNSFPTCCVAAFSGLAADFTIGFPYKNNHTAGATSIQAGSLTPTVNNCLVIAGMAYRDTTSVSIGGGFTISDQAPFIGGTAIGSSLGYLIQTSAAAANPTWSWTNSVAADAVLMIFQPTVSASASAGGARAYA
jgi:hypothetical protein